MTDPAYMRSRIEQAETGDREALARLYAEAAAWLREGKALPASLSEWLSGRLQDVATEVWTRRHKDSKRDAAPAVARALRVQRTKPGRPASPRSDRAELALAGDVHHFITWEGVTAYEATGKVASHHPEFSRSQIEAAWERFKDRFPLAE